MPGDRPVSIPPCARKYSNSITRCPVRLRLTTAFVVVLLSSPLFAAAPEASRSAAALKELQTALEANPTALTDLAGKDFASVPLTKTDAAGAKELLWKWHVAMIRKDRAAEVKDRLLKDDKQEMPFFYKTFGKKPAAGWSLWISLHGGGGAPKNVNDGQWENQK